MRIAAVLFGLALALALCAPVAADPASDWIDATAPDDTPADDPVANDDGFRTGFNVGYAVGEAIKTYWSAAFVALLALGVWLFVRPNARPRRKIGAETPTPPAGGATRRL